MGPSTRQAPARELLEANHVFPGSYLIKAFGPANESFRADVSAAISAAVGARAKFSERLSSKGNSLCITVDLAAETVDEVLTAYERLHGVPELKMIL